MLAGAVVSWLLRIGFIVIVPARRLPESVRRLLDRTALAALAALLATALAHDPTPAGLLHVPPALGATVVGALVSARTRNMGLTVLAAVAAMWVLSL